ncbi:MAG: DUF6152 family protein [Gammaproteobacteria bacterium]|nr:DUF6152 family protein [Gammaproteobacteria bacterium]MDH3506344.1 DUF6152 family protein [Gammaproteobacteria bacterium]
MRLQASMIGWAALLLAAPLAAHHAQAPFFDQNTEVEIEGIVTRFDFRNPHPVLYVDVTNDSGDVEEWQIQFANATGLRRRGWHKDIIGPGERIRASGHPSWNPETHGLQGRRVLKEDGSVLGAPVED